MCTIGQLTLNLLLQFVHDDKVEVLEVLTFSLGFFFIKSCVVSQPMYKKCQVVFVNCTEMQRCHFWPIPLQEKDQEPITFKCKNGTVQMLLLLFRSKLFTLQMLQSPVVSVQVSSANVCWTPYCNDDYGHIYNIDLAKDNLNLELFLTLFWCKTRQFLPLNEMICHGKDSCKVLSYACFKWKQNSNV